MKKIIMCTLFLGIGTMAVFAQEGKRDFKRHHAMLELNLSEDQKAKMKQVNEEFRKSMMELKQNENITVKDQKNQMMALRKRHKEQVQGILTADQKAKIETMKAERKVSIEKNENARMDRLKSRLNLTDDQVAKLNTRNKELSARMKSIRENNALSDEQEREQMKTLMYERKESMKSILTKEQLEQLKAEKKDGHKKKKKGARKQMSL